MLPENLNHPDLWHTVLDTVVDGLVMVDSRGFICHINDFAAKTLGIPLQSATGRHFRDVFCPSLPMDQCWVNSALLACKDLRHHTFEMESPEGGKRKLTANFTPFRSSANSASGALIALRFEDQNQHLRQEHEKQDAILGSLAEGLFTVDNDWRITGFNRAAEKITGWKEEEVLGRYCKEIFSSPNCAENCPLAETLKRSKPIIDYELEYRNRSGHSLPVRVNTAILYASGGAAIGGVVSFRDCSIRRMVEDEERKRQGFYGMIGKNKRMFEIFQLIREIAESKATVLILGESGTGKEMVANAVQALSPRKNKAYVRVNCAAIPDTLLESELFGHVKGAFTDAHANRVGRFEMADSGTIFLDEVGDLTPSAQLRLLRVLEEGEFQRLGHSETIKVDVRVIAATNRDIWRMVQGGTFRDDLYYRLNVIPITLPPLRERLDDLPYLVEHFMEKYRSITKKAITEISDKAYDLLTAYPYPGNVRELENIIEHAFVRTNGNVITESKLPFYLRQGQPLSHQVPTDIVDENDETMRIRQVLAQCHWNRQEAARKLGMSRTTLWRRMRELDLMEKRGGEDSVR